MPPLLIRWWPSLTLACLGLEVHSSAKLGAAFASEEPWFVAVDSFHFPHIVAVDLQGDDPLAKIKDIDADWVLVEFYAPWCPHCRHFALPYERVAKTLSQQDGKPKVVAAKVDCVMFDAACKKAGIAAFPMLMWASKEDWLNDAAKKTEVKANHQAEDVIKWIEEKLGTELFPLASTEEIAAAFHQKTLELQQSHLNAGNQQHLTFMNGAPLNKADPWDMQVAVALFTRMALEQLAEPDSEVMSSTADDGELTVLVSRDDETKHRHLLDFVKVLQQRLPGEKCNASLADLMEKLADQKTPMPDDVEKEWRLCGTDWSLYGERGWRSCRGTLPGNRGFTCGLWTLLHAVAAGSSDQAAGHDLMVMRNAIGSFFQCEDCRRHFVSLEVKPEDKKDQVHMQLWWWRTHNAVNARVKKQEVEAGDGDIGFPKVQWPTPKFCPSCRSIKSKKHTSFLALNSTVDHEAWDLREVASFLKKYYTV